MKIEHHPPQAPRFYANGSISRQTVSGSLQYSAHTRLSRDVASPLFSAYPSREPATLFSVSAPDDRRLPSRPLESRPGRPGPPTPRARHRRPQTEFGRRSPLPSGTRPAGDKKTGAPAGAPVPPCREGVPPGAAPPRVLVAYGPNVTEQPLVKNTSIVLPAGNVAGLFLNLSFRSFALCLSMLRLLASVTRSAVVRSTVQQG
jgi:hypothetical protein